MSTVTVRELRNEVSAILRRVEAGERLTVTVNGRPVAELVPIETRPTFRSWEWFERVPKTDPALADELRQILGDETTDDVRDPWQR
jgi:prevent-host-death family protein